MSSTSSSSGDIGMEDSSNHHTATDMSDLAATVRRRPCNLGKVPATSSQSRNGGPGLFGRRIEESSNGTPREILARLDSLSAYSTQKRLAEEAQASDRSISLSSTSASIRIDDLATTSSALRKILSTPKKPSLYQDPVPFMRLPAELRVMIYERTWTIVDCPWKMTLRAGRRGDRDRFATGIEYWLGPAPKSQVQYPKVIMKMDSRIKEEFVHELCARFPVQMYISGLFTERIPDLSIHKPSVFFKPLRNCQVQYFPRFLSDPSHATNASGNWAILRTDLASLVKFSLLFPCLEKMVIHMPLDFRVLISDDVTSLNLTGVLQTIILDEVFREGGREHHTCFSLWKDGSFVMGWHTGGKPRLDGTNYYVSMCTALSTKSHDAENCTSVRCQCTAIVMAPHRSFTATRDAGRRLLDEALQWTEANLEQSIALVAVNTVVFRIWPYSESLTTLLGLNAWREALFTTFVRLLLETIRAELILDYSRKSWRKRNAFYGFVRTVGHRMWQTLAILIGDVPLFAAPPSLARFGDSLDRSVSFIIELTIGVLLETFLHAIWWVTYGLYLFMPQTMSFLLIGWYPADQLKDFPGFSFLESLPDEPGFEFLDQCFTGPDVAFGLTGCGAMTFSILIFLHMLFTWFAAKQSWQDAVSLARPHRAKIARACGNVQRDLRDLDWTIRTMTSWATNKALNLFSPGNYGG